VKLGPEGGWVARRRVSSGERGAAGAVLQQYSYLPARTGQNQPMCVCERERATLVFFSLAKRQDKSQGDVRLTGTASQR
jgi:hypothetical protein